MSLVDQFLRLVIFRLDCLSIGLIFICKKYVILIKDTPISEVREFFHKTDLIT